MPFERASGILLHPASLPSRGGIGDLGPAAYEFVDFLSDARQGVWQVLPLSPISMNHSPYSSTSAFAGNPLLISLERLADRGWISHERVAALPDAGGNNRGHIDYDRASAVKMPLLREAAQHFLRQATDKDRACFEAFCRDNGWWLEDFVLFQELRQVNQKRAWDKWPTELAWRNPEALARVRDKMRAELDVARVMQFAFFEQWRALRGECARRGIKVLGDVAIFVNYDSADVWVNRDIFRLDDKLQPVVVSGVPPDGFSKTGQYWGNPLYRWDVLKSRGYDWWVQRMRWALQQCDFIRLDHFRGFESYWEIPGGETTAVNGHWVKGPADDLFHALRSALGDLPFIAEDLGMITAEVHAMRQRLQIPGMRVLQFGFDNPGAHIYLPHKFERNTVVYTGTHDNDTTAGWWKSGATEAERRDVLGYLGSPTDGIHWAFIRAAEASIADLCIIPVQDVLGLGSDARMNTPSRTEDNWTWRLESGALTRDLAKKLALLVEVSDRTPARSTANPARAREEFAA
jgi:4-alpha-glucanotransferase